MKTLLDLNLTELEKLMAENNQPSFRAKQIFENINNYKKINEISNISKDLKEKLLKEYCEIPVEISKVFESKDGTKKFLFKLSDGNLIEGVLMSYKYGNTICVSTQIGCRMNCSFCASGLNGLVRNLSAGEIIGQVLCVNNYLGGNIKKREITNIVLMGSGEPFDNYENVVKFLRLVIAEEGINVSARNISLSTCGLVDKIKKFTNENLPITLTISLHAPNQATRKQIMPISNAYDFKELVNSARNYFEKTGRRVVFEYCLIKGVNDKEKDMLMLADSIRGFPCHVNLIPLNEVKERNLKQTSRDRANILCDKLNNIGISATVRRTMGEDIAGACGQLRSNFLKKSSEE